MAKKRIFGEIPGAATGATYPDRHELYLAGVHRHTQAGIAGTPEDGADSIVVSGGYKDDIDQGNVIIYTGHGGRDKNGRHVKDQELLKGNLALVRSQLDGLPVRVVRGADRRNKFAPASGYRYDGLFRIESHWHEIGAAGFKVWRFKLVQDGVMPLDPPDTPDEPEPGGPNGPNKRPTKRTTVTVQRVVRDTALSRKVKKQYDHSCQVCSLRISTSSGPYAEAAHIRPLGAPHDGPDTADNIICLCPNHHTMFDLGIFTIANDFTLIGINGTLYVHDKHSISSAHLEYHRDCFYEVK